MQLTEKEVRYVANLANLTLTEAEIGAMAHDLSSILGHMDRLSEINTDSVEPMRQVLYDAEETATLRPDVERAPLGSVVATENSTAAGGGYFKVPKVIER